MIMKKIILLIVIVVFAACAIIIPKACNTKPVEPVAKDTITFESIVTNDYNYVDSTFKSDDPEYTHFYEVRAYMHERVDSAAKNESQIDSLTTIFAVGTKVYFFNHKIINDSVVTDTTICQGPFVEDCVMPWPLPITFKQMMEIVKVNNLVCPNKDITLRRALIWHPKDYPDFTIKGEKGDDWYFISTADGTVRNKQ